MKVKMLTIAAGPDFAAQPGDVVEVDAVRGADLIKARCAEAVDETEGDPPAGKPATEKKTEKPVKTRNPKKTKEPKKATTKGTSAKPPASDGEKAGVDGARASGVKDLAKE